MLSSPPTGKPSLKVPKENNRFLCWPPASESDRLLDGNRSILNDTRLSLWFRRLRKLAREQALDAAKGYMAGYAPALAESISSGNLSDKAWVVGGHQPELYHPGVWFKNFLMNEISRRTDSVGFQVIIDHDVARSDSLRIPSCMPTVTHGESRHLLQRSLPLPIRAGSEPRMPWHATRNGRLTPDSWDKTIESTTRSMTACGLAAPLLQSRKSTLAECISATTNIGDAFSQFRHRIEMDHDIGNLEVPIGHLCDDSAFGLFVHHCVCNAESLWTSYNRCRDGYRARHKIRNQGQPVLELQKAEDWFELPFWIYRKTDAEVVVRNRLWVSKQHDHYLLSDNVDPSKRTVSIELSLNEQELPERWFDMVQRGICIRPRALMTTMYLRCFVADLFVHGIGGGTYDELTDDILLHWLGVTPPTYLISSASLYLPFRHHSEIKSLDPSENWGSLQRKLQLMRSVPERFLDPKIASQCALLEAHKKQIVSIPARGQKLRWHTKTAQIKKQIEIAIAPKRQAALAALEAIQRAIQQDKILNSREYSFVLFDEQDVVGRLSKLARAAYDQSSESGK